MDQQTLSPDSIRAWRRLQQIVREAAEMVPVAEAVLRDCDAPGPKGTEPARSAGVLVLAFHRRSLEVETMAVPDSIKKRVVQLLNYHSELIGQVSLMAYRDRTERSIRARGSGGLGPLALELVDLAHELAAMPAPPKQATRRDP
jgi:hypothetical protein